MPAVPLDGLSFCGFAWIFKLLPSKHTDTSVQHATPFAGVFLDTSCKG
jgi:hypothetical protein